MLVLFGTVGYYFFMGYDPYGLPRPIIINLAIVNILFICCYLNKEEILDEEYTKEILITLPVAAISHAFFSITWMLALVLGGCVAVTWMKFKK